MNCIVVGIFQKVNLRKTPMIRTRSAPVVGRVLPDSNNDDRNSPNEEECSSGGKENIDRNANNYIASKNESNGSSDTNGGAPITKAAVIAELEQSSQVGGVREWKEELRRREIEKERAAQRELSDYYQPLNFVAEV